MIDNINHCTCLMHVNKIYVYIFFAFWFYIFRSILRRIDPYAPLLPSPNVGKEWLEKWQSQVYYVPTKHCPDQHNLIYWCSSYVKLSYVLSWYMPRCRSRHIVTTLFGHFLRQAWGTGGYSDSESPLCYRGRGNGVTRRPDGVRMVNSEVGEKMKGE